jgi:hypothetical protein
MKKPNLNLRRYKRICTFVMSDNHAGYQFGLVPPNVKLPKLDDYLARATMEGATPQTEEQVEGLFMGWYDYEVWTPELTATQKQLWEWFETDRQAVLDWIDGDPFYLIHIGDTCQGNALPRQYLMTPRFIDQLIIAEEILAPIAEQPNCLGGRFVKGTTWHAGYHGSAEMTVARLLQKRTKKPFKVWYHMDMHLDGIRWDIAHHGPNNSAREWLAGNSLRYYTRDLVARHLKNGEQPPDVVLRGHYHDRKIEVWIEHLNDRSIQVWSAICPAYALFMDDYTLMATKSKPFMTAGMLVTEQVDGKFKGVFDEVGDHSIVHTVDIRMKEQL